MSRDLNLLLAGMVAIPVLLDRKKQQRQNLVVTIRETAQASPRAEALAMSMAADLIEEGAVT